MPCPAPKAVAYHEQSPYCALSCDVLSPGLYEAIHRTPRTAAASELLPLESVRWQTYGAGSQPTGSHGSCQHCGGISGDSGWCVTKRELTSYYAMVCRKCRCATSCFVVLILCSDAVSINPLLVRQCTSGSRVNTS